MRATIRASARYQWYAIAVIMLGSAMASLDGSIANVAVPTIARAYGHSVDDVEWVLLSFMLVTASTLVFFGRLGDIFGQKRIYLGGFAIFGIGSIACAMAPSLGFLIIARAVQALGASMLISSNQALIVDTFPANMRGRAIGLNGAAVSLGLSAGPVIGGAIVTFTDWKWIFLINIPVSIVALIGAAIVLKPTKRDGQGFDPLGATLSIVGLFALSLALSRAHVWGWSSPYTIGMIVGSIVVLSIFIVVENRVKAPTLDLQLFNNRLFRFSVLAAFLYFIAFAGVVFIIPLAAQTTLAASPLQAGFLLVPITLMNIVLAPTAGALSDRVPVRYISTLGATLVGIGTFLLSRVPAHPQTWQIVVALIILGCGTSVFSQPNNSAIMGSAPANRRGIAAGTLATARTTGQLLGTAIAGAVYFTRVAQLGPLSKSFAPATTYFAVITAIMVVVIATSWARE